MLDSARTVPSEICAQPKPRNIRTFIVRVWLEELGKGQYEWRGRVQDVMSGQVCFFRGWEYLTTTILKMLANQTRDTGDASEDDLPTQKR